MSVQVEVVRIMMSKLINVMNEYSNYRGRVFKGGVERQSRWRSPIKVNSGSASGL